MPDRRTLERSARPIGAGLLFLLIVLGLLGSAIRAPSPHGIAVGLSGPPAAVTELAAGFEHNAAGAFAFTTYGSEAEARAAIDRRDVVAALIIGPAGPHLVVAGAAGDAISTGASGAFTAAFKAQGTELSVETVHPMPAGDQHGILLFCLVLATLLSSVVAGASAVLGGERSTSSTIGVVTVFAVLAGVLGTLAAAWLADGLGDGLWLTMGLASLLALSIAAVVAGSARLLGAPGVALAAFVVVLLGLVSSGGPLGSEFLPDAYRAIAPWLPVAPAIGALRGALGFGGVGMSVPVVVLGCWTALGLVLLAVAGRRRPRSSAALA